MGQVVRLEGTNEEVADVRAVGAGLESRRERTGEGRSNCQQGTSEGYETAIHDFGCECHAVLSWL